MMGTRELWWFVSVTLLSLSTATAIYNDSFEYHDRGDLEVDYIIVETPPESHLLNKTDLNCSQVYDKNSSSEFPNDLFTEDERNHGAVILHFIAAMYCFGMIGIVCGEYFLPSVDCICCDMKLSQDVAAATFMSFATSTPEFFTILIGTFITETDIGIGAVVGSGMFNILGVATCGGLAASKSIKLDWWPLYRDSVIYIIALAALVSVIWDQTVTLGKAIGLFILYILYFVLMAYNQKLKRFVTACVKKVQHTAARYSSSTNSTALTTQLPTISIAVEEPQNINNNIQTQAISFNSSQSETQEDELGNGTYKPYFINYSRKSVTSDTSSVNLRRSSKKSISSANSSVRRTSNQMNAVHAWNDSFDKKFEDLFYDTRKINGLEESEGKAVEAITGNEKDRAVLEGEIVEEEQPVRTVFQMPDGSVWESISWLVMLPATFLFYITIPDCRLEKWRRWYFLTFTMCVFWIGVSSYFGTWMISVLGDTIGIPDSVMGLTFLAAGGSMPEAMSTVIMARQGAGGIGFSNSLGGNTMDICLCLAVPWLIKCILSDVVHVESEGLYYNCFALFIGVFVLLLVATVNKFHMNKKMGIACFLCYIVFIVMSILIEIGVIVDLKYLKCS